MAVSSKIVSCSYPWLLFANSSLSNTLVEVAITPSAIVTGPKVFSLSFNLAVALNSKVEFIISELYLMASW